MNTIEKARIKGILKTLAIVAPAVGFSIWGTITVFGQNTDILPKILVTIATSGIGMSGGAATYYAGEISARNKEYEIACQKKIDREK